MIIVIIVLIIIIVLVVMVGVSACPDFLSMFYCHSASVQFYVLFIATCLCAILSQFLRNCTLYSGSADLVVVVEES